MELEYDFYQDGDSIEKIIVAIHGWQGNRDSMKILLKNVNIPNVGWYFIEAPYIINENNGRSWSYEISEGKWEIEEPKRLLNIFFTKLFDKYSSKKVYVVGFSQGGLVCLDFVPFIDKPLGGIFSICGFLREPNKNINRLNIAQIKTPILIGHGKDDDRVPVTASEHAFQLLREHGANVELLIYNGKHKIGMKFLKRMKEIILL